MDFQDKTLVCADCGAEFIHSATDQQRYSERGFTNEPKRCPTCREKRKAAGRGGFAPRGGHAGGGGGGGGGGTDGREGGGGGGMRPRRQFFTVTCAECGKQTEVPFKPTEGRPVYCRECYQSRRV